VAAPLRDHTGAVVAAISVSGPDMRMTTENLAALVPQVLKAAFVLSQQIGFYGTQSNAGSPQ
jgi:DNA-binding IclR family transcriptional regulator